MHQRDRPRDPCRGIAARSLWVMVSLRGGAHSPQHTPDRRSSNGKERTMSNFQKVATVAPARVVLRAGSAATTRAMASGSPLDRHGSSPAELKARMEADRAGCPYLVYRHGDGHQV